MTRRTPSKHCKFLPLRLESLESRRMMAADFEAVTTLEYDYSEACVELRSWIVEQPDSSANGVATPTIETDQSLLPGELPRGTVGPPLQRIDPATLNLGEGRWLAFQGQYWSGTLANGTPTSALLELDLPPGASLFGVFPAPGTAGQPAEFVYVYSLASDKPSTPEEASPETERPPVSHDMTRNECSPEDQSPPLGGHLSLLPTPPVAREFSDIVLLDGKRLEFQGPTTAVLIDPDGREENLIDIEVIQDPNWHIRSADGTSLSTLAGFLPPPGKHWIGSFSEVVEQNDTVTRLVVFHVYGNLPDAGSSSPAEAASRNDYSTSRIHPRLELPVPRVLVISESSAATAPAGTEVQPATELAVAPGKVVQSHHSELLFPLGHENLAPPNRFESHLEGEHRRLAVGWSELADCVFAELDRSPIDTTALAFI